MATRQGFTFYRFRMGDDTRVTKGKKEFLTGAIIGFGIGVLMFHKVIFGADLSTTDVDMIARTVEAEAGNQDLKGKRLVACVILNRVESETFPDTVDGVLSQTGQFSTYKTLDSTETTHLDRLAVSMEIKERSDEEIVFFRASRYGCGVPAYKHGDHYFSTIE